MLTDLDKQIVARDSSIPGLELLFDDSALLERLQTEQGCGEITSVHVDYLRYKLLNSCIGRLRIQTTDGESLAYAKAFRADATDKLAKAERSAAEANGLHQFFAENALAVYRFPADRVLPALGQFTDASTLPYALRRLNADFAQLDISLEPLHYKPERRFAAKLSRGDHPIAAVKLYTKRGYELARRAAKCFNRPQDRNSPRCIGHSDVHAALAFEWVDGTPLSAIPSCDKRFQVAMRKMGPALQSIHRQNHSKLLRKTPSRTVSMLRESLRELTWIAPDLAAYTARIYEELVRRFSNIEGCELAPIHGDLHLNQVLLAGESIQLLDFDRACLSDPMEDLGRMYAGLMQAEPVPLGTELPDSLYQELVEAYAATGAAVSVERINVYAACRLWETICEPFRYRHADWPSELERRVCMVDQILIPHSGWRNHAEVRVCDRVESYTHSQTIDSHDPFNLAYDHALMRGCDALNPMIAKDILARIGSYGDRHVGIDLQSIRVTRHKPGRRSVIEYAGKSLTTGEDIELIGKLDSKARYRRFFEQQCRLWRAGFERDSADGICVAQPWNLIPEWYMWLQQKAPGENCWKALGGSEGCTVARRIAQAIHKLQSSSIKTDRSHSLGDELQIVDDRLRAAAIQAPNLANRIASLREACHDAAEALPAAADVPVHRDFYPDQLLVGRERIVLIDFDLLAGGNPALDVGNFLGHLIEHSLRVCRHAFYYAAQQKAFLREYSKLSGVPSRVIAFFTALTLARHVYLCLTLPGRSENARRVLDVAINFSLNDSECISD